MQRTSFKQATWFKIVFLGLINAIAIIAFALDRKVTIPADPTSGITLLNSSDSAVTYDLRCYATDGVAGLVSSNLVLSPKSSTNISYAANSSGAACALGTTNATYGGTGMAFCDHSTGYTAAATSVCGAGWTLCTAAQWNARRSASTNAWLSSEGFASTYSTSYDTGATFFDTTLSGFAPISHSYNGFVCATQAAGAGTQYTNCHGGWTGSTYGSMCCAIPGYTATPTATASCEVTVKGAGHLQSRQFKGNAPF